MKRVTFAEMEKYEDENYARPVLFRRKRATSLLLCLKPGQAVPPHRHEGFVALHPPQG